MSYKIIKKSAVIFAAIMIMLGCAVIRPQSLKADEDSACRLIVKADSEVSFDEDVLIGEYDDLYLLQYDSEKDAEQAMSDMAEGDIASMDTCIYMVQTDQGDLEKEIISDEVMTESDNPFTTLSKLEGTQEDQVPSDMDVALIDTGASIGGNIVEAVSVIGSDPSDDNGHGTLMAGYMASVDEDISILSIKALDSAGRGSMSAIVAAFKYAMNRGVRIINLSVCAYSSGNSVLSELVKDAVEKGILVVGAAGNYGSDAVNYIPGNIEEALIVGAVDNSGCIQAISNYGDTVDLYMPASSTSEAAALMSGWLSKYKDELDMEQMIAEHKTAEAVMKETDRKIRQVSETENEDFTVCSPVYEPDLYWYPVREDNYIVFTSGVPGDHNYRFMWRADWWDDEGGPSDTSYEWKSLAYCVQPDNQDFPRWVDVSHPSTDASEDLKWASVAAVLLLAPYADEGEFYNAAGLDGISLYGMGADYITILEKGAYFTGHVSDETIKDILFAHMLVGRLYNGEWSSHAGSALQAAGEGLITRIQNKLRDTSSLMYRTVKASEVTFGNPNTQIGSILPDQQQKVAWVRAGEVPQVTGSFQVTQNTGNGPGILKISKQVVGGRTSDNNVSFEFTLTADRTGISYKKYSSGGQQVTGGAGSGNGTSILSGGSFTLASGEYVLISLPAGCTYKVAEKDDASGRYSVAKSGAYEGTVTQKNESSMTFAYTVTLKDEAGNAAAGQEVTYAGRIDGSSAESGTKRTDSSGQFTFSLSGDASVSFSGIPAGHSYVVTSRQQSGYDISTPQNTSGNISADSIPEAVFAYTYLPGQMDSAFTNTAMKTGVTIRKRSAAGQVVSQLSSRLYSQDMMDAEFRIRVYARQTGNLEYDALYHPASYQKERDGSITANLDIVDNGSRIRVYSGSFSGLYPGDKVQVTEVTAPKGYLLPTPATQTIDSLKSRAEDNVLTFTDMPGFAPQGLEMYKYRAAYDNGKVSIGADDSREAVFDKSNNAGAIFLMEYYDNYDCSGTPARYWYFMNDADGRWTYGADWLVKDFENSIFYSKDTLTCLIPSGYQWGENSALYSDTSGRANLPLGSFAIREVWAPAGFSLLCDSSGEPAVFKGQIMLEKDAAGTVRPVMKWLSAPSGLDDLIAFTEGSSLTAGDMEIILEISKVDGETGAASVGAEFLITDTALPQEKYTIKGSTSGYPSVRGFLKTGHTYVFEEVKAADGYVLNEDKVTFYIGPDGTFYFEDHTDSLGTHRVPEVTHYQEGTDKKGNIRKTEYTVKAKGQNENDYEITYTCTESGSYLLNVKNYPNKLRIIKSDEDGKALNGVCFTVKADYLSESDRETIIAFKDPEYTQPFKNGGTLVTDEHGEACLYRLKGSESMLVVTEVKSAEGMSLLASPVYLRLTGAGRILGSFDLKLSGKTYRFYGNESRPDGNIRYDLCINDMDTVSLMTGGAGTYRFYLGGMCLASCAALFVIRINRLNLKKRNRHE